MLLTGQISVDEGLFGAGVLLVWVAVIVFMGQTTYRRLRVR